MGGCFMDGFALIVCNALLLIFPQIALFLPKLL